MPEPTWTLTGLDWLLTFALHSTVLLLAVWLTIVLVRGLSDTAREQLWKTAVVGGLLTASWQVATDAPGLAGHIVVQSTPGPNAALPAAQAATPPRSSAAPANAPVRPPSPPSAGAAPNPATRDPMTVLMLLYGGVVLVGLTQLAHRRWLLHRWLRDRKLIVDGPLPLQLLRLTERAGLRRAVRLTESARLNTPIAFGIGQPEICIPARARTELDVEQQEAMLAHELAHLAHGDPQWLLAREILQRVLFWQPLLWVAARQLDRLAEYRCDAWASRHAPRVPLAQCLVEVAGWLRPADRAPAGAPAMATPRSMLRQRVDRILAEPGAAPRRGDGRGLGLLLLITVALALPSASWGRSQTAPVPAEHNDAPDPLSLPVGLDALHDELSLLDAELASLQRLAARRDDPEIHSLLSHIEAAAAELRAQRARLLTLLPAALDALRARDPAAADSVSTESPGERP